MSSTLLVGSGAVRNAWVPVNRALRQTFGFVPAGEGANFAFANLVFQLRWLELPKSRKLIHRDPTFAEFRKQRRQQFDDLRINLARELDVAKNVGELNVRPEVEKIADRYFGGHVERVITTNWDRTLDEKLVGADLCHIHEVSGDPGTLYLPSETAEESYRDDHERQYLRERVQQGFRLLDDNMQHLVIWGLSLSPLDIELGVLLGEALLHRQDCRITVIDPGAHDVAERVRFQCRLPPIYCGTPDELYLDRDFERLT